MKEENGLELRKKAEGFYSMTGMQVHLYETGEMRFQETVKKIFESCASVRRLFERGGAEITLLFTLGQMEYSIIKNKRQCWILGPVLTGNKDGGLQTHHPEEQFLVMEQDDFEYTALFFAGAVAGLNLSELRTAFVMRHEETKGSEVLKDGQAQTDCRGYIQNHLGEPLSLQLLADYFGYNKAYFSRKFKQLYGMNLNRYIQNTRLHEAAKALRETDRPLVDISGSLCFASQSHFQNTFKSVYHMTPMEYRRQYRFEKSGTGLISGMKEQEEPWKN